MFGQLCVVLPLDGLGDGDAANAGDATMKAPIAATATINARTSPRNRLRPDVGGVASALSADGGLSCSPCSVTLRSPLRGVLPHSVTGDAQSSLSFA
jgi:hypothetical protein